MNGHAMLSPSSSERWLKCTPSAFLESLEPYQESNIYAAEGTDAHALAELKLSYMLGKISTDEYATRFEDFLLSSQFYNAEFNDYVNDYCNEVMTIISEDYKGEQIEVYLEGKVDFDDIVPKGSGTSDVIIVGKTFVHVIDLKFGKGVPVSAMGNTQLRLYALGAIKKYRLKGIFDTARMTIIQPRLYDITTDTMSVIGLNDWALNYVKPRAELAILGQGDLVPGDHCRFCRRKGKCESLGQHQLTVAQQEFETVVLDGAILEPQNMTPEMLSRIMKIAPKFIDWFNDVTKYVTAAMVNDGLKVPGYKVVEGRSNRVMINPDAIADRLAVSGFSKEDYLEPVKLLGITKLEQNIGKKLFDKLCGEFVVKPIGRPTIALESDRRQAIDNGQFKLIGQEFNDEGDYQE